jgi:hypothetical protein
MCTRTPASTTLPDTDELKSGFKDGSLRGIATRKAMTLRRVLGCEKLRAQNGAGETEGAKPHCERYSTYEKIRSLEDSPLSEDLSREEQIDLFSMRSLPRSDYCQ